MTEREIFVAALHRPDPADRRAFLDAACGPDAGLRARLDALLAESDRLGSFLEQPAAPPAPTAAYDPAPGATTAFDPAGDAPPVGNTIGPYKLLEVIGEGGMGTVWMAEQTEPIRRRVALKVIKPGMDSRAVLLRFEAERQALALMDHPHIARVLDAGSTPAGRPYFVMELVRGVPITQFCDERQLGVADRLRVFQQVCGAVQHAHQKGVIHRDLKPSNILVESHDGKPVPKVIDFGLAKAVGAAPLTDRSLFTGFGAVLGTPLYMAPEQADLGAVDVDTRADVYALGVVLYELLTGTTPVEKKRLAAAAWDEVRRVIREEEPPAPSARLSSSAGRASVAALRRTDPGKLGRFVRGDLDWVVMKALAKERGRRYESAAGLAADVERFLDHEPVAAGPPTAGYKLRRFVRRNRRGVAAAGVMLLVLAAGTALSTWQAVRATAAERAAEAARRAEADRAEAERQARQDAQRAADAEKAATEQAKKRLAQIEKGVDLLASVFDDLDVLEGGRGDRPLEAVLADRLAAAGRLHGEAVGDPVAVAKLQNRLGTALNSLGFPARAIPLLETAAAVYAAAFGPDHENTLICQTNLATAYQNAGRVGEAVRLLERTAGGFEAKLGFDHPYTLNAWNSLGMAYSQDGRPGDAIRFLTRAVEGREKVFGIDGLVTLKSHNALAAAYTSVGRLDRAIPLHEQTLKLSEARHGANHPDTQSYHNGLAAAWLAAEEPVRATPLFERVAAWAEARLGANHPRTLTSRNNLAAAYAAAGRVDEAVALLEDCFRRTSATLGPDHPDTLNSLNNLARGHADAGRLGEAIPLYRKCFRRMREMLGPEHPNTLSSMSNLALTCLAAGKEGEALPLIVEWVNAQRRLVGAGTPEFAGLLAQISTHLLAARQHAAAEPYLRECLAIREKVRPDDWTTSNTRSALGGSLLGQAKLTEAEPLLLAGYEGMKAREKTIPLPARDRLGEAADRLVDLYVALNKPDEAARWRAERAKYPFVAPPPRPANRP